MNLLPEIRRRSLAGPFLLLLLAACAPSPPPGDRPIVVAVESPPGHLDPRLGSDQTSERIADAAFSGLLRRTAAGLAEPDLAGGFTWSPDGRELRVRLRPGLRFVDGRPLTARDAEFTFSSLLREGSASPKKGAFASLDPAMPVRQDGPLDVVFRCRRECPGLPLNLGLGLVPAGTTPEETLRHPVGSGPMTITGFAADEHVMLHGPRGDVELRVLPDATSRALALLEGSVDVAVNALPPDVVERFRLDHRFTVLETRGTNVSYLAFNCTDPILGDVRVRRAIAAAVDRAALLRHLHRGLGDLTESLLPSGHVDRADPVVPLVHDPDRARRLLDEARHPSRNGAPRFRLTYRTSTDETAVLQATAIAAMLGEVGIAVDVRPQEFGAFYEDVKKGKAQMWSLTWTAAVDADLLRMVFASDMTPPTGWNRGRFSDARVDRALATASLLPAGAARRAAYGEAESVLREEVPLIPLWHRRNVTVVRRGILGATPGPLGDFSFLAGLRREPASTDPRAEASPTARP